MTEQIRDTSAEVSLFPELEERLGKYFASNENWMSFAFRFPEEAQRLATSTLRQMEVYGDIALMLDDEHFTWEADIQARIAFKGLDIPLDTVIEGTADL